VCFYDRIKDAWRATDRRLRDVQILRRAAVVRELEHGQEIADAANFRLWVIGFDPFGYIEHASNALGVYQIVW